MYKEDCLDIYNKCINDIVVPNVDDPTIMESPWLDYSKNMLECNELFDFCKDLDEKELEELDEKELESEYELLDLDEKELEKLEREYDLLVKEAGTNNGGGYKAKKKSKTKKHYKTKKRSKTKKYYKTKKHYKTKKRYKTNKLSKKCSKTKH